MVELLNVSNKLVSVAGIVIKPLESKSFNWDSLSVQVQNRVNTLVGLGVLKMFKDDTSKKSNKKSK
jgi:hypothetical protein